MTDDKNPKYGAAVGDEDPNYSPMDEAEANSVDMTGQPEQHVIVFIRDAAWQFTYRGSVTGPFSDRNDAVNAAIELAQSTGEKDVEVMVQEPDLHQTTVWRASD